MEDDMEKRIFEKLNKLKERIEETRNSPLGILKGIEDSSKDSDMTMYMVEYLDENDECLTGAVVNTVTGISAIISFLNKMPPALIFRESKGVEKMSFRVTKAPNNIQEAYKIACINPSDSSRNIVIELVKEYAKKAHPKSKVVLVSEDNHIGGNKMEVTITVCGKKKKGKIVATREKNGKELCIVEFEDETSGEFFKSDLVS